jgi:hypothetical protein
LWDEKHQQNIFNHQAVMHRLVLCASSVWARRFLFSNFFCHQLSVQFSSAVAGLTEYCWADDTLHVTVVYKKEKCAHNKGFCGSGGATQSVGELQ